MRAVASLPFLLLAVFSCSEDPVVEREAPQAVQRPDVLGLDREAEEAALWLSNELTAPLELYETIHSDLAAIRAEYGAVIPNDYEYGGPLQFTPWWLPSELIVYVTTELRDKVLAHAPNPLDSLNAGYHAVSMDPFKPIITAYGWRTHIYFAGRQHPKRLAEIYRALPGVNLAGVDGWIGDYSNVYPWRIPGGMSYLFRNAFGDCLAGCMESHFYYFRRMGGTTEFVGWFRVYQDPYPAWWPEASDAFCAFEVEKWGWPYCPWSVTPEPQSRAATPGVSTAP